ncbi:hypothetical protein KXW38_009409, partial [Aspergillus fumigatus]
RPVPRIGRDPSPAAPPQPKLRFGVFSKNVRRVRPLPPGRGAVHCAAVSSRQQFPARLDEYFRADDDIGVIGVFDPVMADAADRRHEQHARRHDGGEYLRVMAGAARHPQRPAAGKRGAGGLDRVLERCIHRGGRAGADAFDADGAGALRGDLGRHAAQLLLQALDHGRVGIAHLKQHPRTARDDAGRAGFEGDAAGGPHRARPADRRERLVDRDAEARQRKASVHADGHPRGAGVVLRA